MNPNSEPSWRESSARLYRALNEAGVDPDLERINDLTDAVLRSFLTLRTNVSSCCHAPLRVAGNGSTHWYACGKCGEATDPVSIKPMDLT